MAEGADQAPSAIFFLNQGYTALNLHAPIGFAADSAMPSTLSPSDRGADEIPDQETCFLSIPLIPLEAALDDRFGIFFLAKRPDTVYYTS
jgi:hypothetical protein